MSNDLWRWADPNGQQRKVRLDELRSALAGGTMAANTPVWKPGWKGWKPAEDVPELREVEPTPPPPEGILDIPPPPLAVMAVQHDFEAQAVPEESHGDEPPPPPTYVPLPTKNGSMSPPALGSAMSRPPPPKGLPTTIGLPPPPEVLAAAAARAGGAPPPPGSAPAPAGSSSDPMIEELSGSVLLDDASVRDLSKASSGGLPPPTEPVVHDSGSETVLDNDEHLPTRPPGLTLIFDDLKAIRAGQSPKNKLLLGVLGVVGASVLISLVALVVSAFSGKSDDKGAKATKPAASSSEAIASASSAAPPASAAIAAAPVESAASATPPPAPAAKSSLALGECRSAGDGKTVAPRAVVASGVEAVVLPGAIGIGFAAAPHDATVIALDPSSLAASSTLHVKAGGGDVRRVSPLTTKGKLGVVADVDRKGDKLAGRRVIATNPPIDIGVAENAIVWAPHGEASYAKLFALEGDGAVEALRGVPLASGKGIAIAFRRGNAINVGIASGDAVLKPEGELSKLAGLGQVGSPTLAASGDNVVVAWADRAGPQGDWQVRFTQAAIGSAAKEPKSFTLPEGGLGGQAMSPSVAALGEGRFLLAWTEGPVASHQVRALTMNADGSPIGAPVAVSASGVNAGQPQVAVGPDGRGAVAFLASKGKAFEVQATPISCAAR